jgi:hypothetical protein
MSNEDVTVENASDVLARNLRAEVAEWERRVIDAENELSRNRYALQFVREDLARAEALIAKRRATTDSVTLAITHDADALPRVGDVYEGRAVVDRADSDDGRSVTLWFKETP